MYVLGIDVGGTKSVCLLADERGKVVAAGRGQGANLHASGERALEKALRRVMVSALGDSGITPAAIALGIAGVDRDSEAAAVRAIVERLGYSSHVVVVNDALIALVAGAGDGPGVAVIAGTGSIAYGRNADNVAARAGGWGHIIGDEGSRYWIGREALAAVARMLDGRGPRTALAEAVLAHFKIADASELPRLVYDHDLPRMNVAALGPVVQRARNDGDAAAVKILDRAAGELALAAASVVATLGMRDEAFPFVLAGGVFRAVPWLGGELSRRLTAVAPRSTVALLTREPAAGAVTLAIAEATGGVRLPRYQ